MAPLTMRARRIPSGAIHLWLGALDEQHDRWASLAAVLGPSERQRASRYVFERDRFRFVIGRAFLRHVLSAYLDEDPAGLDFVHGAWGKPALARPSAMPLRFSFSRAGGLAACALALGSELGVDIERERELPDAPGIAATFFSRTEVEQLRGLPPSLQRRAFFSCWTRKEAFVKATGEGLGRSLDGFSVSLAPGAPARLEALSSRDGRETQRWSLIPFEAEPDYVGAVAVPGRGWSLETYRWEPPAIAQRAFA